jgi:hypothetical protein
MRAPQFSLPLARAVASLPRSDDNFGRVRHFDAKHRRALDLRCRS